MDDGGDPHGFRGTTLTGAAVFQQHRLLNEGSGKAPARPDEGVIVKGGPAKIDKDDRQPHLSDDDARALLANALRTYRREHHAHPARVVVHKTSKLSDLEVKGFQAGAEEERVEMVDLISVRRSFTRLFRGGSYPPLREPFWNSTRSRG
jgi:hypothetical protein